MRPNRSDVVRVSGLLFLLEDVHQVHSGLVLLSSGLIPLDSMLEYLFLTRFATIVHEYPWTVALKRVSSLKRLLKHLYELRPNDRPQHLIQLELAFHLGKAELVQQLILVVEVQRSLAARTV